MVFQVYCWIVVIMMNFLGMTVIKVGSVELYCSALLCYYGYTSCKVFERFRMASTTFLN